MVKSSKSSNPTGGKVRIKQLPLNMVSYFSTQRFVFSLASCWAGNRHQHQLGCWYNFFALYILFCVILAVPFASTSVNGTLSENLLKCTWKLLLVWCVCVSHHHHHRYYTVIAFGLQSVFIERIPLSTFLFFSAPYMCVGEYLRKATWSGSSTSSESECQRESLTLLIYGIVFHLKVAPPIMQKQAWKSWVCKLPTFHIQGLLNACLKPAKSRTIFI